MGKIIAAFKAWSNFRLMVLVGSAVTLVSLFAGAIYVQTAITGSENNPQSEEPARRNVSDSRAAGSTDDETPPPPPSTPPSPPGEVAKSNNQVRTPDQGQDFTLTCAPVAQLPSGAPGAEASCRVTSFNGFAGKVDLACSATPPELGCQFSPRSVTPPANGFAPFQFQIASSRVRSGSYLFDVVGRSGSRVNSSSFPLVILPPVVVVPPPPVPAVVPTTPPVPVVPSPLPSPLPDPTFTIACTLQSGPEGAIDRLLWSLTQGSKATIKCLVTPRNGFDDEVKLELANVSDQILLPTFNPPLLNLSGGSAEFVDLNFELGSLEKGKEYNFDVTGTGGGKTLVKRVVLTITE